MAFLDIKMQHGLCKFDWDDINVGSNECDDSQNFFSKTHYEHERLDEMELFQQKAAIRENDFSSDDKENINKHVLQEQLELEEKLGDLTLTASTQCHANEIDILGQKVKSELKEPTTPCCADVKCKDNLQSPVDVGKYTQDKQEPQKKVIPNLACEWSTKKVVKTTAGLAKGTTCKTMPPPPQAYLIKDIYQRKREEAERRRAEEERMKRVFHSRPVPKFEVHHEQLQKRKPAHAVTTPITPQVLKKSREADEKRRRKLEEWKLKNQPPKFEHRPPTVLKEKPFEPEKKPTIVQQCPFKLHVEKRLQERKQYDESKHKALEEKQKQEEEERQKLEKERIKEIRKATTFKARPNPFKN